MGKTQRYDPDKDYNRYKKNKKSRKKTIKNRQNFYEDIEERQKQINKEEIDRIMINYFDDSDWDERE